MSLIQKVKNLHWQGVSVPEIATLLGLYESEVVALIKRKYNNIAPYQTFGLEYAE